MDVSHGEPRGTATSNAKSVDVEIDPEAARWQVAALAAARVEDTAGRERGEAGCGPVRHLRIVAPPVLFSDAIRTEEDRTLPTPKNERGESPTHNPKETAKRLEEKASKQHGA